LHLQLVIKDGLAQAKVWSAVDDAEHDRVRAGRRCRFTLDETKSSNGSVRVAKLVLEK
jgi:hypothetical protein